MADSSADQKLCGTALTPRKGLPVMNCVYLGWHAEKAGKGCISYVGSCIYHFLRKYRGFFLSTDTGTVDISPSLLEAATDSKSVSLNWQNVTCTDAYTFCWD